MLQWFVKEHSYLNTNLSLYHLFLEHVNHGIISHKHLQTQLLDLYIVFYPEWDLHSFLDQFPSSQPVILK